MRTERGELELETKEVPAAFLSRFMAEGARWWSLIIVSPWITPLLGTDFPLEKVLQRIREQNVQTYVITRRPEDSNPPHGQAVDLLMDTPSVELRYHDGVHAKIYLAEGPRTAIGIMGSANLTASGIRGTEVGVLMRGRGLGEALARDLIDFCMWDLRESSKLIKSRSSRRPK
jgi:hypothetical protein